MTRTSHTRTDVFAELRERGADDTIAEIAQQPELWRQVAATVALRRVQDVELAELLKRDDLRIVLTGAGTSAYAGGVLAPALRRSRGHRVEAIPTTDIVSDPYGCLADDVPTLLVSFARSGDSPESVAATELADRTLTECHHLILTCNEDGRLARNHVYRPTSHVLLMPRAANDRGFAMTSSFTCMVIAARLLIGAPVASDAVARIADSVELGLAEQVRAAAGVAAGKSERIAYLGSGSLAALAREAALKVLELTAGRVAAIAETSMGFRHGPKAFLDESTLSVVFCSNDPYTRRYDLDILTELATAQPVGAVIAISAATEDLPAGVVAWPLRGLDDLEDALLAPAAVIAAQLLALQCSLAAGIGSDDPFPSDAVNRVVQGVTVHPLTS